jgi:hypothetical protein
MAQKTAAEKLRVGRSPGRDSGGRVVGATASNGVCALAVRKLTRAKRILDPDTYELYAEAVLRIDAEIPHLNGYHGIPGTDALDDIAVVERAINTVVPPELELHSAELYDLIDRSARYND